MTGSDLNGETAIGTAAAAAGMSVSPEEVHRLAVHVRLVYETAAVLNLTTVPLSEAPVLHVVDSLAGLGAMGRGGEGPWIDLGSGAGFPGIPLCIVGHRHVDLVDSTGKKARFLDAVAAELCLDATVRAVRAEDAARETPGVYAAASARAVGPLPELVELASPLLRSSGVLVAWKGAVSEEELRRGRSAGAIVGMAAEEVIEYRLPDSGARRSLVVFAKTGGSKVRLPRRPGLAKKSPLA